MRKLIAIAVVAGFLCTQGCALWQAEKNRLNQIASKQTDLPGMDEEVWKLLKNNNCTEALKLTDLMWGRKGYNFEDLSWARLRALICLGLLDEAHDLADAMGKIFPWRRADTDATGIFIDLARNHDREKIKKRLLDRIRKYPESWIHRLLLAQLLIDEGALRDAREQTGIVSVTAEQDRCGFKRSFEYVEKKLETAVGLVGDRTPPMHNAAEGVFFINGYTGVAGDYCHGDEGKATLRGWLETVTVALIRVKETATGDDCTKLMQTGLYGRLWDRCIEPIDFQDDPPERILMAGELALRIGMTGRARTCAEALLHRRERIEEAHALLSRVYTAIGLTARAEDNAGWSSRLMSQSLYGRK